MPTFNRLQYLPPAIESVLTQTFKQWELIIADDGSGAEMRSYLRSLIDPRISVIWLKHTGKPSAVSNNAMRRARGTYIAFLDSDDLWLPGKLQAQLDSLRRHPQRGWSYTRFSLIDAAGNPIVSSRSKHWAAPSGWILEALLDELTVIAQPSVVVARELLARLGAFDEDLVMCYDDELWFRLAAHSEIDGIEEPLTLVRRHGQHSGSDVIAWRDRRRVFEKFLQARHDPCLSAILRKRRADMSAGLAASLAASGERISALHTLVSSAAHSWRYPRCWLRGLVATGRSFVPAALRALVRRHRYLHSAHRP
ncbi:MAG TPA: glycosyltransferase [Steroidobacteraceae bacterium]